MYLHKKKKVKKVWIITYISHAGNNACLRDASHSILIFMYVWIQSGAPSILIHTALTNQQLVISLLYTVCKATYVNKETNKVDIFLLYSLQPLMWANRLNFCLLYSVQYLMSTYDQLHGYLTPIQIAAHDVNKNQIVLQCAELDVKKKMYSVQYLMWTKTKPCTVYSTWCDQNQNVQCTTALDVNKNQTVQCTALDVNKNQTVKCAALDVKKAKLYSVQHLM